LLEKAFRISGEDSIMNPMRTRFGALLLAALVTTAALAQRPYRLGQEIEFKLRGEWTPGKVLRVMPDGKSVQVRATINGRPQSGVVPLEDVRPVGTEAEEKPPAAAPATVRTWSDSSGQFKIEAVYLGQEGEGVKLLKNDGAVITVPLAKLSKVDQDYVAGRANSPAAPRGFKVGDAVEVHWRAVKWYPAVIKQVDGNRYLIHYDDFSDSFDEWFDLKDIRPRAAPANQVASGLPAAAASESAKAKPALPVSVPGVACRVDKSAATPIDSQGAAPSAISPDPGPAETMPEGGFALRKLEFFEKPAGMLAANVEAGLMLVAFVNSPPGKASTQLEVCDLSGKQLGAANFLGVYRPIAGRGGGWLLTAGDEHANPPQYHVWKWPKPDQPPEPGYQLNMVVDDASPFAKQISRAWIHGDLRSCRPRESA
jgi:hypothetical protein